MSENKWWWTGLLCLSLVSACGGGDRKSTPTGIVGGGGLTLQSDCYSEYGDGTRDEFCGSFSSVEDELQGKGHYTGTGVGVWVAMNDRFPTTALQIDIGGLSGQQVYLAYSNWGKAPVDFANATADNSSDSDGKEVKGNEASQLARIAMVSPAMIERAVEEGERLWTVAEDGDVAVDARSVRTRLAGSGELSSDMTVHVWIDESVAEMVSSDHVDALIDRLAGRKAHQSLYEQVVQWLGALWGEKTDERDGLVDSEAGRSLHVVISSISAASGGYRSDIDLLKRSINPNSNEALVVYLDAARLIDAIDHDFETSDMFSVLPTLLHDMVVYYEKTVSRGQTLPSWISALNSTMFLNIYDSLERPDAVLETRSDYRAVARALALSNCRMDTLESDEDDFCSSDDHRAQLRSFAAYLIRSCGPKVVKSTIQGDWVDAYGLGRACLDDFDEMSRRWTISSILSGTALPRRYGFPAEVHDGVSFPAIDPTSIGSSAALQERLPSRVARGATVIVPQGRFHGRFVTEVVVPRQTTVTVIVQ